MIASVPSYSAHSGTVSYGYDSKDQLTQETSTRNGGYSQNQVFDPAGNPTTLRSASGLTYHSHNQTSTNTYDASGNPTTYKGSPLAFDAENRLTAYGSVQTNDYRPDGLRARKTASSTPRFFVYDGLSPLFDVDSSGNVVNLYTTGANGFLSWHQSGSALGNFFCFDPSGNLSQRLDSNGTVGLSAMFDAWGNRAATFGSTDVRAGFASQWGYVSDVETGLTLCGMRHYDSTTGRWLTRDPIGYNGGINLYAYCQNNGVTRVDPGGTDFWKGVAIGALAGATIATGGGTLALAAGAAFVFGGLGAYFTGSSPGESAAAGASAGMIFCPTPMEGAPRSPLPDCKELAEQLMEQNGGRGQLVNIHPPIGQVLKVPPTYRPGIIRPPLSHPSFGRFWNPSHTVYECDNLIYDPANMLKPQPWESYVDDIWGHQPGVWRFPE